MNEEWPEQKLYDFYYIYKALLLCFELDMQDALMHSESYMFPLAPSFFIYEKSKFQDELSNLDAQTLWNIWVRIITISLSHKLTMFE